MGGDVSMDRVSNLPDEVLSHILSFLTIKEAALTSLLSKKWRNLFAFVPNLDIDDSVFLHPEEGKRERDRILQSFIDFVNRVLALQGDSPIKKFSLKVKTGIGRDRVNRWICNVLQRGVTDLDLSIESGDEYFLPLHMFFNKKLVELKLTSDRRVHWCAAGEATFLPMLKTLVINRAQICRDKIEMFLLAFPVLEELDMSNIEWKDLNETVSSVSLRKLTINAMGGEAYLNPKSISFDIPNLLYLDYTDVVAEDYPKVNLINLVDARINLLLTKDQLRQARAPNNDEDDVSLHLGNAWKLMSGVKNVQELLLSYNTLEVLSLCSASIPVFNNLRELCIMSNKEHGWQVMPVLLRNSPHLETLVLAGLLDYETEKCGDACDCISVEDKGCSLRSCPVKKLQIMQFKGTPKEMRMIKHFLDYFPCLKKMDISASANSPTLLENPEMFQLILKALELYHQFYTCHILFLVRGSFYKEWTTQ